MYWCSTFFFFAPCLALAISFYDFKTSYVNIFATKDMDDATNAGQGHPGWIVQALANKIGLAKNIVINAKGY